MNQIFEGFSGVPHTSNQIVSYLSGKEILRLREVNKAFKNFVDSNLKYFYKKKRERNLLFPDVTFTSILDLNIKLFINSNKLFVRKILKDKDLPDFQLDEMCNILDDSLVFDFVSYIQMGIIYYQAWRLMSYFSREQIEKFLYLYEKNIASTFYCDKVAIECDSPRTELFIQLKRSGISDYYSLEVAKKCPPIRINYFLDLLQRGIAEYYAFKAITEFSDKKISQFSVLHLHFKISVYYSFLVCNTLSKEKIISFVNLYEKTGNLAVAYSRAKYS